MTKLTCGERLDDEGNPIPGTGFEYDSDGEVAELLAQRISPVLYSPTQGEWVWMVPDESNGEFERIIAVCPTGNNGPFLHYHPTHSIPNLPVLCDLCRLVSFVIYVKPYNT